MGAEEGEGEVGAELVRVIRMGVVRVFGWGWWVGYVFSLTTLYLSYAFFPLVSFSLAAHDSTATHAAVLSLIWIRGSVAARLLASSLHG